METCTLYASSEFYFGKLRSKYKFFNIAALVENDLIFSPTLIEMP